VSQCGECTLCCDLLAVPPLGKPVNTRCKHCEPSVGCAIWNKRPPICRRYQCLWLPNPQFPNSLRPDRCGALSEPVRHEDVVVVNVDPLKPGAWQDAEGPVAPLIQRYLNSGTPVVVMVGKTRHVLLPKGVRVADVLARIRRGVKQLGAAT